MVKKWKIDSQVSMNTGQTQSETLIDCDPKLALERGMLDFGQNLGLKVNFIAGGYIVNELTIDPLIGGMIYMDWAAGNIHESPQIIGKYFNEQKTPAIWWNDARQVPQDFDRRLSAMGLRHLGKMVGLYIDTQKLSARVRPAKTYYFLVRTAGNFNGFCDVYSKTQPFEARVLKDCIDKLRKRDLQANFAHHVGYLKGRALTCGSVYSMSCYALLTNIGTVEKARRRGFGSMMIEELIGTARVMGYKYACCFVPHGYVSFFEKQGFERAIDFDVYGNHSAAQKLSPAFWQPLEMSGKISLEGYNEVPVSGKER